MIDNGGYVYPQETGYTHGDGTWIVEGGKTLLDDFAGQAMKSLVEYYIKNESPITFENMAEMAYEAAEAMIKIKRKREE